MNEITKYAPLTSDEKTIIAARQNRIANLDAKVAYKDVLTTITSLFPMYGIDGDFNFYATIAKEIIKTFGQIAAVELEIAFRLFAAAKLDLDDDVKFYGKANMHTIGKILTGYQVYRRNIIAAHDRELEGLRDIAEYEATQKAKRQAVYDAFPEDLRNYKGDDYHQVPVYYYDLAINLNMLHWETGEKAALWSEAQAAALLEKADSEDLLTVRSHMRKIADGNKERAVVIAQKMAVFNKLIKNLRS